MKSEFEGYKKKLSSRKREFDVEERYAEINKK